MLNDSSLPRSSPETQGISSQAILSFIQRADKQVDSMHSFMLVRHGHVIAECWWTPEAADKPHVMWSLSKSFASTAIGLAIEEGRLTIDDLVLDFFPGAAVKGSNENLQKMRVRDLLTMSTGHQTEPPLTKAEGPWLDSFLSHPVPFKPGTHFQYNSAATYLLAVILKQVSGQNLVEYLNPRLLEPLGIATPQWDESPEGISIGGWGLYLRTEDIAKFGQLYLQKGVWKEQQLVPAHWIKQATSKQVSNGSNPDSDWDQGYGFQFWRCRHDAYRGDGRDGQFCVVLPEHDVVVAMTAMTADLQGQLSLVWDELLPGFSDTVLPSDQDADTQLQKICASLVASRS